MQNMNKVDYSSQLSLQHVQEAWFPYSIHWCMRHLAIICTIMFNAILCNQTVILPPSFPPFPSLVQQLRGLTRASLVHVLYLQQQPHSKLQSFPSKMHRTKERFDTAASQFQFITPQLNPKLDLLQKKKAILLKQLENELRSLDDLDDTNFKESEDPYFNDKTLERLQMIAKEAAKLEIKEIQKLCRLAIGKRILNIELKKKKDEHNEKLLKKEKIELFFRENRIKRYDYSSLIEEKLEVSTLVARAYDNGKGFVESDRCFRDDYEKALQDCDYMGTIKEVNKMFYQNYTGVKKNKSASEIMLKYVWVPIVVFICLGITIPFASFLYEELVLMGLLGLILLVLFYSSVKAFRDRPSQNNQIQQTISDVRAYFSRINQQLQPQGIEWSCGDDFMYLQVTFHSGFPID